MVNEKEKQEKVEKKASVEAELKKTDSGTKKAVVKKRETENKIKDKAKEKKKITDKEKEKKKKAKNKTPI
ncbi:hypothetical protein ACFL2E_03995, partial [Thermodesulfobacteriota bacterium]